MAALLGADEGGGGGLSKSITASSPGASDFGAGPLSLLKQQLLEAKEAQEQQMARASQQAAQEHQMARASQQLLEATAGSVSADDNLRQQLLERQQQQAQLAQLLGGAGLDPAMQAQLVQVLAGGTPPA